MTNMEKSKFEKKESIKVLNECADIQLKKSRDYQNPNSRITQSDYYPRGVMSIMELINTKTIRLWSIIEAMENDPDYEPNFESIEDSLKDLINYASFAVAYSRGKIEGQKEDRDFLNREIVKGDDS
tara:strand:- start:89 stop:466 length:378 start_codon:yes stop_codon:yes gene_type:complete